MDGYIWYIMRNIRDMSISHVPCEMRLARLVLQHRSAIIVIISYPTYIYIRSWDFFYIYIRSWDFFCIFKAWPSFSLVFFLSSKTFLLNFSLNHGIMIKPLALRHAEEQNNCHAVYRWTLCNTYRLYRLLYRRGTACILQLGQIRNSLFSLQNKSGIWSPTIIIKYL